MAASEPVRGRHAPAAGWANVGGVEQTERGTADGSRPGGFEVHLEVFEGPFDLLLGLISKHKLDVTEVALSQVTDEFIGYIRAYGPEWDLDQASHFLIVAATLLDLKAARLLPSGEVDDEADLALLEARDLLFARLLQYRAYKQVASVLAGHIAEQGRRFPRQVPMEPRFADLLPEVLLGLGPLEFARLAARTLTPKPVPEVSLEHLHAPRASVREQATILVDWLRQSQQATFADLSAGCAGMYEVVARFLALLELYRQSVVTFEQEQPLGELNVHWAGGDEDEVDVDVTDDYEGVADPEGGDGEARTSHGEDTSADER